MIFCILLVSFVAAHGSVMPENFKQVRQPQPYSFGYTVKDHEGVQHRQETGNGAGVVHGNYGFVDNKGLRRQVEYVADHSGFRAHVKTNEPGTAGQSPAAVNMISNDPYAHGAAVPYVSRVNDPVVPALYESDGVYGFSTPYDHRPYSPERDEPTGGYKFITPVNENRYHMPALASYQNRDYDMPVHITVPDHIAPHRSPVRMPTHPRDYYMPSPNPDSHRDYQMPSHVPVSHRYHHMPLPVPAQDHVMPYHARMPVHPEHSPLNTYERGYNHMHEPSYMGGLAHGNLLGAGYRGYGGVVNFGANLVGGVIRGHDSRFTNL